MAYGGDGENAAKRAVLRLRDEHMMRVSELRENLHRNGANPPHVPAAYIP